MTQAEPDAGPVPANDALLERLRAATIGEYEVYGELGRGGMAVVYLAHEIALDRKVAIKVMLPELVAGVGMVERFRREARTAGALSHPHIIPIHAVKDVDGLLFFVMKFVEGRGLDSIIRELGPLPLRMVETVVTQVAGALSHAHRKNVIHRDIKPANVMIDEDGWAVVADFGIAKVQDAASLTTTGAAIGTPYYMSPEQGSGKPVSGAADQYSLGIMAYEMLTGVTPFRGPSVMEVMSGHFFNPPEPINGLRPDCPAGLELVVMRMLAKNPADRFGSLEDVIAGIAIAPLAHDDPIRTQMVTLARSGGRELPRTSVPVSPSPAVRRARPGTPKGAAAVSPRRPFFLALMFVLLAAVGVAGGVFAAKWRAGTVAPPSNETVVVASPAPTPAPETLSLDTGKAREESKGPAANQPSRRAAPALPNREQARLDSLARWRSDSITRARADSIARAQRPAATETVRVVTPLAPVTGTVIVGTRTPNAVYYIDAVPRGALSNLRSIILSRGDHQISINAVGCAPWDTLVTVRGGDTIQLRYRTLTCQ